MQNVLDSFVTELNRIVTAKEDLKTAINSKGGNLTENDTIDKYAEAVEAIEQGVDTSDATAAAGDILSGETAYVDGAKLSGSMPNNGGMNQSISKDFTAIPPKVSIPEGYTSGGDIDFSPLFTWLKGRFGASSNYNNFAALFNSFNFMLQAVAGRINDKLPSEAAKLDTSASLYDCYQAIDSIGTSAEAKLQYKSVTPTKSVQHAAPDNGYDGLSAVTVAPIPDEYISTSDATASAEDILSGKTAYVNGEKITGTLVVDSGGASGGITPFTVAYGTELPDTVVENQLFVITEQTPTVVKSYCQSADGIEISISYTGEPVDDVFGSEGSMELSLVGDSYSGIKVNLGNGVTFNTGIAASVTEDGYEYGQNFVFLYDSSGMGGPTLTSYFGNNGAWMKMSDGNDDSSGYSLRRTRRT